MNMKRIIIVLVIAAVVALGFYGIKTWLQNRIYNDPNFAYGNGRIEATEINIAAKLAGKVEKIKVFEGDKVEKDQVLVVMQTNVLEANLAQAKAKRQQAIASEISAKANIAVHEAKLKTLKAELVSAKATLINNERLYKRSKALLDKDATSLQHSENQETNWLTAKARVLSCEANIKQEEANILVAKADAEGAKANIQAAEAEIASIEADIDDSILKAPLKGRIQYRIAEPGEVLSVGGRALNMINLTDVYMTFFLPEEEAGKVKLGADARIVLDALPKYPIPAKVTYVASVAQFTPKTVETKVERQKLMFRIKVHVDRKLLEKYIDLVKTGIPGMAWVRLNPSAPWPKSLQTVVETENGKVNKSTPAKAKGTAK